MDGWAHGPIEGSTRGLCGPKKVAEEEFITKNKPEKVVDDLDPTKDGEASKEAHGTSY